MTPDRRAQVMSVLTVAYRDNHPETWDLLARLALDYGRRLAPPVTRTELDSLRDLPLSAVFLDGQPGPEVAEYGIDRAKVLATIKILAATALPDLADAGWRKLPAAQVTDIIARQVLAGVQPYLDNHVIQSVRHLQDHGIIVYVPPEDRP